MRKKLTTVMNRLKLMKLNTVMNRLKLKKLNTVMNRLTTRSICEKGGICVIQVTGAERTRPWKSLDVRSVSDWDLSRKETLGSSFTLDNSI